MGPRTQLIGALPAWRAGANGKSSCHNPSEIFGPHGDGPLHRLPPTNRELS